MWQYANSPARRHEKRIGEDDSPPTPSVPSDQKPYAHFGSPSLLAGAKDVVPTYTAHVLVVVVWDTLAVNPSAVPVMVGPMTPLVVLYAVPRLLLYFTESAKYASSAVIRLRRSDFIEARYAFSFVFANFGIAIAAKMPMITTTIRSSISVKPLRFIWTTSPRMSWSCGRRRTIRATPIIPDAFEARTVPWMSRDIVMSSGSVSYVTSTRPSSSSTRPKRLAFCMV